MATIINIHEAKTHLSRLLERVQGGEEITIAKAGRPIARLLAIQHGLVHRVPGMDSGKVTIQADFDEPVPAWEPGAGHREDPLRVPLL